MEQLKNFLSILTELNKTRITFVVTLTTLAGYVLANKHIDSHVILPMVGIFILACGSAALNHFQDRDKDALMERTQNRPLPAGRISERNVLLISAIEIIAGTWIIYIGSNLEAAILGFMAFIWYNGIYTPLKRVTAFAVIPGSVIGAIPPKGAYSIRAIPFSPLNACVLSHSTPGMRSAMTWILRSPTLPVVL